MISSSAGAFSAPSDSVDGFAAVLGSVAAGVGASVGGGSVGGVVVSGAVVNGAVVGAIGGAVVGGVASWITSVDAMRA